MSSILAKINLTAHASFLNTQCRTNTTSSQLRVRFLQTSQLWYRDTAAYNARQRERYANDPELRQKRIAQSRDRHRELYANDTEYRQRMLQYQAKRRARAKITDRPEHIQKYLNDKDYRESVMKRYRRPVVDKEAKRKAVAKLYKQNVNNFAQKQRFLEWVLRKKWPQRLVWETHEPLISEGEKLPALCASCEGVFTRKLWWRRKETNETTGEQLLDCHNCFCNNDWEKALPLGYRGHVFGGYTRLKQPDWENYPPSASSP